jgi:hypothetical protein
LDQGACRAAHTFASAGSLDKGSTLMYKGVRFNLLSHRTVMRTQTNPNSLANLKRFKPGAEWTGNAGGRPKRKPLTEALEAIYANPEEAMAAAIAMARKVKKGDTKAFVEVVNRIEGKVAGREGNAKS